MFKNLFKNKEIELAEKVVKANPDNIIKLNILGQLYMKNYFFNEAIFIFEKILKIDENYLPALEALSKCYIRKKEYLKAFRTLKYLYSLNKEDSHIKTLLLSLENVSCDTEAKIEILKELYKIDNSTKISENLGYCYFESGQFAKSATIFENLLGIEEKPEYLIKLSEIYEKIGKYNNAAICLEKLMLTDNFNSDYAEKLAYFYFYENRFEESKGIYELLIQSKPKKSKYYNEQIAKISLAQNNPDEAIIATNKVIVEDIYSVEAKFIQAQALIENKDFEEAIEFLREFYCDPIDEKTEKKIINEIVKTCIAYSQKLREEKNFVKAIDILTPALRYDDTNKEIYIELSKISEDIKDFSAAKEYIKIAENL